MQPAGLLAGWSSSTLQHASLPRLGLHAATHLPLVIASMSSSALRRGKNFYLLTKHLENCFGPGLSLLSLHSSIWRMAVPLYLRPKNACEIRNSSFIQMHHCCCKAGVADASRRLQPRRPELQFTTQGQGAGWAQMSWKGRLLFKCNMEVLGRRQEDSQPAPPHDELLDENLNFEANI